MESNNPICKGATRLRLWRMEGAETGAVAGRMKAWETQARTTHSKEDRATNMAGARCRRSVKSACDVECTLSGVLVCCGIGNG